MSLSIREARPGDEALVLDFVRKLADYEKLLHEVTATGEDMREALFGGSPRCRCDLAFWNGEAAGFALWFYNFSTFAGKAGIYLEDLFVEPHLRGKGIGKALLKAVARLAVERKAAALSWLMMGWNTEARGLYEKLGATIYDDNCFCKLSGEALERLAS